MVTNYIKGTKIQTALKNNVEININKYIGYKYKFGAIGKNGYYDCSGFVRMVYKNEFNIELPRDSRTQYKMSKDIKFKEIRKWDLLYFGDPISHTGIYIGEYKTLHCVRNGSIIEKLDKLKINKIGRY